MSSYDKWYSVILITAIIGTLIAIVIWCVIRFRRTENFKIDKKCLPDTMVEKLKAKVEKFLEGHRGKFTGNLKVLNNKKNMLDTLTVCKGNSSYTIDKEQTFLCVVDKKKNQYYDEGFLMHVMLHELSHVICPEIGHTKLFDTIFTELMIEAEKFGIYDSKTQMIGDYCGLTSEDTYTIDEYKVKKYI